MPETEVIRAVAAEILTERKLKLGQITEAERDDATEKAWEQCANLARRLTRVSRTSIRLFIARFAGN